MGSEPDASVYLDSSGSIYHSFCLATPALAAALTLLFIQRNLGAGFFGVAG